MSFILIEHSLQRWPANLIRPARLKPYLLINSQKVFLFSLGNMHYFKLLKRVGDISDKHKIFRKELNDIIQNKKNRQSATLRSKSSLTFKYPTAKKR